MNKKVILEKVRTEIYSMFRDETNKREHLYTRRDWIFPNHFDVMIEISNELCEKYGGDKFICELGILFHDVGLVYKRENSSPVGHEERSMEFATIFLNKIEVPQNIIEEVVECVRSTQKNYVPNSINGKIVITSDVMAHVTSVHYFAKAIFYGDWDTYLNWLKPRMNRVLNKIQFDDEREKIRPIRDYILNAIEMHERMMKNYPKELR